MADFAGIEEAEEIAKMYGNYPPIRVIIGMCRLLGIEKDNFRTIEEDDAWEYFYELLSQIAETMTREQLYESFADYFMWDNDKDSIDFVLGVMVGK